MVIGKIIAQFIFDIFAVLFMYALRNILKYAYMYSTIKLIFVIYENDFHDYTIHKVLNAYVLQEVTFRLHLILFPFQ